MPDLALSSYWKREHWESISGFFQAGADLGFRSYEISGLRRDTFYDEIRPGQHHITSFHNPAPPRRGSSTMGNRDMRRADIGFASLDRERRQQAIMIAQRCVDVAGEYGAHVVVLHLGQTDADPALADRLGHLLLDDNIHCPEADAIRSRLMAQRERQHTKRMAALQRSLDDLVLYASARGVRLGVENRPISEMPNFDEVQQVMAWYADDTVGYWHDTGHAQVQEALGFTPHADWLRAFGHRLVGLHLHDAAGMDVHKAPGAGSVDWAGLAPLIPAGVLPVMEVDHTISNDSLLAGIQHLQSSEWINHDPTQILSLVSEHTETVHDH